MNTKESHFFKALLQIIQTGHCITDQVSQELKEFDISEPQYNVLRILRGRKGVPASVRGIQKDMIQRSSNVTRIIDKLQQKDLVVRSECSANRRKMDVTITKKGLGFLNQLDLKVQALHRPLIKNLSQSELKKLSHLIQKLTTNIYV